MTKHWFMEYDKSGAEWVIVAYLANDPNMIEVVESGKSPHILTGCLISGAPEDLVALDDKMVGHHTDPITISEIRNGTLEIQKHLNEYYFPRSMSIRQGGKKSNHGLNYRMKFRRFALENEIEEPESRRLVDLYHDIAYPNISRTWWPTIEEQLRENRTLENCFGRKRRFLGPWGEGLFMDATAFIPQSTSSDVVKRGMIKLYDDDNLHKVDLLSETHDSLLTQYPKDNWERMAEVAICIGMDYMNPTIAYNAREFQIKTDLKVGFRWSEEHMREIKLTEDVAVLARALKTAWGELYEEETR